VTNRIISKIVRIFADVLAVAIFCFVIRASASEIAGIDTSATNSRLVSCVQALSAGVHASSNIRFSELVIGALKELISRNFITPKDLPMILLGQNPLAKQNTSLAFELRDVVDQIITAIEADHEQLAPLVQKLIDENSQSFIERTDRQIKTKDKFTQLLFYPIEPGSFTMGSPDDEDGHQKNENLHQATIAQKFWIANFPVTQWQYAMVMGTIPSHFQTATGAIEIEVEIVQNGQVIKKKISVRPNHPVEGLLDAEEDKFIIKLNELSRKDDPLIYKIIPDHPKYWQYRKPTDKEWEYVARNRGVWKGPYPDGITKYNLDRIAWYNKNSGDQTHAVGELEPILIDGKYPVYDLYGNVWESTSNGVLRGGSWCSEPQDLRAAGRGSRVPGYRSGVAGFRLVRTPP